MIKVFIKNKTVETSPANAYDLIRKGAVPADKESKGILEKLASKLQADARVEIPEMKAEKKKAPKKEKED